MGGIDFTQAVLDPTVIRLQTKPTKRRNLRKLIAGKHKVEETDSGKTDSGMNHLRYQKSQPNSTIDSTAVSKTT